MVNEHSNKIVRLTRRAEQSAFVVAPKSNCKPHLNSVDLSRSNHAERTNITRKTLAAYPIVGQSPESASDISYRVSTQPINGFAFATGVMPKLASLFLIPMILIYPLYPAYAAEESVTQHASSTDRETFPPPSDVAVANVVSGDAPQAQADNAIPQISAATEAASSTSTSIPSEGTLLGDATTSASAASDTPPVIPVSQGGSSGSGQTASSTATTTSQSDATSTEITVVASSSESVIGTHAADAKTEATSTEEVAAEKVYSLSAEELAQEIIKQKEESMRASIRKEVEGEFSKGCLTIDNIGYYCLKDAKGQSGSLSPSEVVTGVGSHLGEGSTYKQIFMTKGGVSTQITHDLWDDAFPSIDVSGKSIVWQGNVNGRWQVFFANAATSSAPSVLALTHSNESNFNPRVDGDDVVWQGWVDGNWEIFLAEHLALENYLSDNSLSVENTRLGIDHSWKVTRITTNSVHDMFPSVSGGLVTWQSFQDNAWSVYAYSVKTGATTKLSSAGAKSENPRFAITWDERTPEGAAHMVGYDIASGKTIDLTNEARQVSDDRKPYQPQAPISQDNQAALPPPATTTATTSVMKGDGDDGSTGNGLGV